MFTREGKGRVFVTSLLREKHAWPICFDCGVLCRFSLFFKKKENNIQGGSVLSTSGKETRRDEARPGVNPRVS